MRPVIFTPKARIELIEAQNWYGQESSGLSRRFLSAVGSTMARMTKNPRQFPVVYKAIRSALLRRFPYALLFVIEPDEALTVIACFHSSRDPMHWQQRM